MILGPFFVPIALLFLFYKLNVLGNINAAQVIGIFVAGGFGSALIAMQLNEMLFIESSNFYTMAITSGITEEIVKALIIVLFIKWMKNYRCILDGLLIGTAIGAGFSALESVIYAYQAYRWFGGFEAMMESIIRRSIVTPGTHIAWSAITGASVVCFIYKKSKKYALSIPFCIMVHALWNMTSIFLLHMLLTFAVWLIVFILIIEGKEEVKLCEERRKSVERVVEIPMTSTEGPDDKFAEVLEDYINGHITLEEMESKVNKLEYL